jgi:hypothetical protein
MTQSNNFDPNSEGQYVPSSPTREKQNNFTQGDVGEYTPPVATFSPEWQQDVTSQAGTGLVQGAAQLLALPGTAVQAGSWLKNKAQDVYGNYQEATGSKPKGSTAQETALRKAQQEAAMTLGEKTGISANLLGLELPTSKGIDWILKNQLGFNPAEPKTDTGRYVKAAMEMVPATVLTGGGGLAARVGIGALSGIGSEAAQDVAKVFDASDTTKAIAGLSGALVGGGIGSAGAGKLSNLFSPGNAALKDFFEQSLTGAHHLCLVKLHHIREIAGFAGDQFGDAAGLCIADALPPRLHGVVHHVFGVAFEFGKFFVPDRKVFGQIGTNDGLEQIFFRVEI